MNCFGSGFITIINYSSSTGGGNNPANAFLLLDGTDFNLLDTTVFLLLGS